MSSRSWFVLLLGLESFAVHGCGSSASPKAKVTYVEAPLTLSLALGTAPATTTAAAATTLTIVAQDGVTPVVTDLWLYTYDVTGAMIPLTGFTSTAARKTPRLMMPATINGLPSGLVPADDGRMNGLMSNVTRGKLVAGAFVSTVDGKVVATLAAAPSAPIVVVAGVEDQRYAGAAAINVDGSVGMVPSDLGVPETHTRRTFEDDVKPILETNCVSCHNPAGTEDAQLYLVTGTADELVNDNFALKEQTEDCQTANPTDADALATCIQAINKAQFLVEPGAPANSDLLQRARPDENGGTSDIGLLWYGGGNPKVRYNATYGDRRMPSTTMDTDPTLWTNLPTTFDLAPQDFQTLYDWVAQGALATTP